MVPGFLTHQLAYIRIVRNPFSDDIPRPPQGLDLTANPLLFIDKFCGDGHDIAGFILLLPDTLCQRLQSFFFSYRSTGTPFRFVGQIQVFHFLKLRCSQNALAQVVGKLILFLNRLQHALLSVFENAQVAHAIFDRADHLLIQTTGHLLAIARDERHCVVRIEQFDCFFDLIRPDFQFFRYEFVKILFCHNQPPLG